MTSNELKYEAKKQEWSMSIQECRGSGLSVSEWCRQRGVTTATYCAYKDIVKLADVLGHSSIETTSIYLVTSAAAHRRQLEQLKLVS